MGRRAHERGLAGRGPSLIAAKLLAAWVVAASVDASPATAANASISFTCCAYSPNAVTINSGEQVTWNGGFSLHPLRQAISAASDTIPAGGFTVDTGSTFSHTFPDPGTYYFYCNNHGRAQFGGTMRGTVTVLESPFFADGFED